MTEPLDDNSAWKYRAFPDSEYAERQGRVRELMWDAGLDVLLVVNPRNLNYLIGYEAKSYQEFQCLLVPPEEGPLTMVCRLADVTELTERTLADEVIGYSGRFPEDPIEVLAAVIERHRLSAARIGLESPDYFLSVRDYLRIVAALREATLVEATGLIGELKVVKSPAELIMIRKAATIADAAMRSTIRTIDPYVTELEVASELYRALLSGGSEVPPSTVNFGSGERTCYSHAAPTDRRIQPGDFMMLEFGATFRRYTATLGRNLCLGEPSARMGELHDVQLAACDALIAAVRPGICSAIPHAAARTVIENAGLDHGRVHTSGYGLAVGFPPTFGETIHFFDGYPYSPRTLEAGMVLTVEPPVFSPKERLGARVIDNIIVTPTGCEIISDLPRNIIRC